MSFLSLAKYATEFRYKSTEVNVVDYRAVEISEKYLFCLKLIFQLNLRA